MHTIWTAKLANHGTLAARDPTLRSFCRLARETPPFALAAVVTAEMPDVSDQNVTSKHLQIKWTFGASCKHVCWGILVS